MQQLFATVAVGVFILASIVIGLRLLHLHRRTGDSPELLLGLMLLLVVGVGYPATIAAQFAGPGTARALAIVSGLTLNSGSALLFLFTWRVFRHEEAWARSLAGAGVVALCAQAGWRWFDALSHDVVQFENQGGLLLMMLAFLWAAWESLRRYGMMRRRMRIGLGDVVVCDRFMLFGVWTSCSIAGVLMNTVAMWMHIDIRNTAWIQVASSLIGLVQAGVLVLAFAPPRFYLHWVRERPRAWAT